MRKQRGQSVVELAFVLPMFTLFLFALIYGGIMFLQYFNLSNDSRAEARRIAVMTTEQRDDYFGGSVDNYPTATAPKVTQNPDRFGRFYTVTQKIWVDADDVVVMVEFNRNNGDLPYILSLFNWPPEELKPLEYRMQIENDNSE